MSSYSNCECFNVNYTVDIEAQWAMGDTDVIINLLKKENLAKRPHLTTYIFIPQQLPSKLRKAVIYHRAAHESRYIVKSIIDPAQSPCFFSHLGRIMIIKLTGRMSKKWICNPTGAVRGVSWSREAAAAVVWS